jgi:type I restriction enzyme R subunit
VHVVYDMKNVLDDAHIYVTEDLEAFKQARGRFVLGHETPEHLHKKLYSATQRPTDVFNSKMKVLSDAIEQWDRAIDKAVNEGDKKAQEYAESRRSEFAKEREALLRFKTDLSRFVRTYNYIAQLIELGDAELENCAAFTKLLAKRLKGVSPEQIDLTGLVLAGYKLHAQKDAQEEGEKYTLKPIEVNEADPNDREKEFLRQIIARMNDLFGDVAPDPGQRHFTMQVAVAVSNTPRVVEQVEKNSKDQALQGALPEVVRQATVDARRTHNDLASSLLKDPQHMDLFVRLMYDIIKNGDARALLE